MRSPGGRTATPSPGNCGTRTHADEWVALSDVASPESGGDADGWFYYLFTADEVRALASVGLQCRLVGNGETLSAGQLTQEQAIEHICQFNGDSFRAAQAKASE